MNMEAMPMNAAQKRYPIYNYINMEHIILSTSSLTMEVEVVSNALRWIAWRGDSRTTHAILLTDSVCLLQKMKSGRRKPDWNVPMVDIHFQKPLWVYCSGHAGLKGNDRAVRLADKVTITNEKACISDGLKCWRAWDTTTGHKAKGITPSIAWRREAWKEEALDDLPWKGRERAIASQTNIGTVSRATLGKLLSA